MMKRFELGLALGVLAAAHCGPDGGSSEVETTRAALTAGGQALCQGCSPEGGAVKLIPIGKTTFCSGALIGPARALTSAKCLTDVGFASTLNITNKTLQIAPGDLTTMTIASTFIHPSFTSTGVGSDAAVINFTSSYSGINGSALSLGIDPVLYTADSDVSDYTFGTGNPHPGVDGTKQFADLVFTPSTAFLSYYFTTRDVNEVPVNFRPGDFGGFALGIDTNANIAGINSFVDPSSGISYITKTAPIRSWILGPTRRLSSSGFFIISEITGKCLQAGSGSAILEAFCNGQSSQQWTFPSVFPSGNNIRNIQTNQCVSSTSPGGSPTQVPCGQDPNVRFLIAPAVGRGGHVQFTSFGAGNTMLTIDTSRISFGSSSDSRRFFVLN